MIERADEGPVTILTVRHGKANAIDLELATSLAGFLDELEAEGRAIVIVGQGSIFSAGVDLYRLVDGGPGYAEEFVGALSALVRRLFTYSGPTVAAVNGHAIAGGYVLVASCDSSVAALGRGRLGLPELLVSAEYPPYILEVVRHRVPASTFDTLILGGATYEPVEAQARGLVDEVAPMDEALSRAVEIAHRRSEIHPELYARTKRAVRSPAFARAEDGERERQAEVVAWWCREETLAAMRRYIEGVTKS